MQSGSEVKQMQTTNTCTRFNTGEFLVPYSAGVEGETITDLHALITHM